MAIKTDADAEETNRLGYVKDVHTGGNDASGRVVSKNLLGMSRLKRIWCLSLALLLGAIAFVVYLPSLRSNFVYDAVEEIFHEGFITNASNIKDVISLKVLHMHLMLGTRPGEMLYLMLNAIAWKTNPFGYHLVSNTLHAFNVTLLCILLFGLVEWDVSESDKRDIKKTVIGIVLVTLLFALHPIAVESVAEISYSSTLLVASCCLFALILMRRTNLGNPGKSLLVTFTIGLLGFLATACKESGIVVALVLSAYWFIYMRKNKARWQLLFIPIVSIGATMAFLVPRFLFAALPDSQPEFIGGSLLRASLAQPRLWVFMISKLLYPIGLSADYAGNDVKWMTKIEAIVVLCMIVVLQVFLARRSRIGALGVALFWLGLVAVSNFVPLYRPLADRYYYLPLAGLAMQILGLIQKNLRSKIGYWTIIAGLTLSLIPLTFLTLKRQAIFRNQFTLWDDTVRVSPSSWTARMNLGVELSAEGRNDDAIFQLERAIRMRWDISLAHRNLGCVLVNTDNLDEAERQFQITIQLDPRDLDARNDLGMLYERKGEFNKAMEQYNITLEIDPARLDVRCNLAVAMTSSGQLNGAILQYTKVLETNPEYYGALNNLAWIFATYPDPAYRNSRKAVELASKANQICSENNPLIMDTLATAYAAAGDFRKAVDADKQALILCKANKDDSLMTQIIPRLTLFEHGMIFIDSELVAKGDTHGSASETQ